MNIGTHFSGSGLGSASACRSLRRLAGSVSMFGMPKVTDYLCRFCLLGLLMTIAVACSRNTGPPPPDQPPDSAYAVTISAPTGVTPPTAGVLYIGARPAGGGPPQFVIRREIGPLPQTHYLTEADRMGLWAAEDGPLVVFERLDSYGDAGTVSAEDWVAEADRAMLPGQAKVALTLRPSEPAPSFALPVRIEGPSPPGGATLYVLLREVGGRVPLAAARYPVPKAFPLEVTLTEAHLLGALPDKKLEVLVKVDQDGNPVSTGPGDLEGATPVSGTTVTVNVGAAQ